MINNLFTFVRTLGNQRIEGKKFFTTQIGVLGALSDGAGSIGTSGKVLSSTGTGVEWITVGGGTSNVADLNDLTDVVISSAASGQLLRFNGTNWVNWTPNFLTSYGNVSNHTDVSIASPATGQLLRYNGTNWVNWTHNFLTTSATLSSLDDVSNSADSPNDGDILRYNEVSGLWVADEFPEFTESDTLDSVTDRGATTTNGITVFTLLTTGTGNSVTTSKLVTPNIEYNGFVTVNSIYQTDQGEPNPVLFKVNWNGDNHFTVNADGYAIATTGFKVTGQTGFLKANGTIDGSTYLTSYTETDTLASVTGRGNSTTNAITVGGLTSGSVTTLLVEADGLLTIDADKNGSLQPEQGDPAVSVLDFTWQGQTQGYIDTDGKITFNGFKTPSGTSSGFLKADGSIDTTQYLTSVPQIGIDDLTDVTITNPSEGDLLRYDDTSGEWVEWTPNYLTTETDPTVPSHVKSITAADISNWYAAYNDTVRAISFEPGDGNLIIDQNDQGTLSVSLDGRYLTEEEDPVFSASAAAGIDEAAISKWSTAYDWGNHADAGYLTTESQTLNDVTTLGNTTTNTIGVGGVTTPYVQFESVLAPPTAHMSVNWGDDHNALEVYYQEEKHFDVGQDQMWYVKNGHETALAKGTVVMAIGAVGNSGKIEVGPLDASGAVSGKYAIGIMMDDVDTGEFGFAMTQGKLRGIDTSELTEGSVLYADPAIPGALTKIEPSSPALKLPIAFVVNASNNGTIAVRMTQGLDLHEVHDVNITNPQELDMLVYDSFNGYWYNSAIPFITEETDPIFEASAAFGITEVQIGKWNDAYDWGNHANAGYLTSYTETDPTVPTHVKSITEQQVIDWDKAYGWGNHADYGYLTSYTETDPTVPAHVKNILNTDIGNWNTAYGWGDHAIADYFKLSTTTPITIASEDVTFDGTVGIGGQATLSKQQNYISSNGSALFLINTAGGGGSYVDLDFNTYNIAQPGFANPGATIRVIDDGAYSGHITFRTKGAAIGAVQSEVVRITSAGNLGIGTPLPASALDVHGTISSYSVPVIAGSTLGTQVFKPSGEWGIYIGGVYPDNPNLTMYNNDIHVWYNTGGEEIFTIANGEWGFGNGAFVYGEKIATQDWVLANLGSGTVGGSGTSGYVPKWTSGTAIGDSSIYDNGNVGIGTTSPGAKLEIAGTNSAIALSFGNSVPNNPLFINTYGGFTGIGMDQTTAGLRLVGDIGGNNLVDIGYYSSNVVAHANWVSRMRITGSGNVGIGTTSPSGKLHVYGGSFITDLDATYHQGILNELVSTYVTRTKFGRWNTASNLEIYYDIAGSEEARITRNYSVAVLKFDRAGTTDMIINGSGNVGIGTTSPNNKLHIYESGARDAELRITSTYADGYDAQLTLQNTHTGGRTYEILSTNNDRGTIGGGKFVINDRTSSDSAPRFVIDSSGNVGIGTTSPSTLLHVNGVITATGGNSTNWNTAYGWGNHASAGYAAASSLSGYLPLTGGTLSGAVVVNLGNVTSDTVAFKVGGPGNYDSLTIGMEDSPDYDAFIASYGNDIRFYSGKNVGTENHSFYWFTSKAGTSQHNQIAMVLDHNQNLSVTSHVYVSGGNSTQWNTAYSWGDHSTANYFKLSGTEPITIEAETVTFTGSVTIEGTLTESSSIRFKENIKPLEPALGKVEQLNPVTYNKIGVEEEEIGLIAEEVAELFPEVVTYNEEGQPQGIQYQRLSVILLKAVQELSNEVKELKAKLK